MRVRTSLIALAAALGLLGHAAALPLGPVEDCGCTDSPTSTASAPAEPTGPVFPNPPTPSLPAPPTPPAPSFPVPPSPSLPVPPTLPPWTPPASTTEAEPTWTPPTEPSSTEAEPTWTPPAFPSATSSAEETWTPPAFPSETSSVEATWTPTPTQSVPIAVPTSPPSSSDPPSPSSPSSSNSTASQCTTGPIQCCNSLAPASDPTPSMRGLLGLLDYVLDDVVGLGGLVGQSCSGLVAGETCGSVPVCCEGNQFNGLINIGCVPIVVSL
ncbi:hypothetical protein AcW1_002973 [Taiwanofungus camphoratus]|nr:hypothetical protein AcW1_002973 [Antrodia cinnamomea]